MLSGNSGPNGANWGHFKSEAYDRILNRIETNSDQGELSRGRHVELAAYFIVERHGFTPGREHEDWLAAEVEIDRMFGEDLLVP